MSDIFFVFGKDLTFFLATPQGCYSYAIPNRLRSTLCGLDLQRVESVALSPKNKISVRSLNRYGKYEHYISPALQTSHPSLTHWLTKHRHRRPNVVFGADNSYIAWTKYGDRTWHGIKRGGRLDNLLSTEPRDIKCAALGWSGSWMIVWEDGGLDFRIIEGRDSSLVTELERMACGKRVEFIALNPHRKDQFFLVLEGPRLVFQVDWRHAQRVREVLIDHDAKDQALTPMRLTSAAVAPRKSDTGRMIRNVGTMVGLASGIANIVTITAGCVAGTMACLVM